MRVADSSLLYVHLLPAMIAPGCLKGGVAVVIDVLRATSVMVHALDAGAAAIYPCLEIDDAIKLASQFPIGTFLLSSNVTGLRPLMSMRIRARSVGL